MTRSRLAVLPSRMSPPYRIPAPHGATGAAAAERFTDAVAVVRCVLALLINEDALTPRRQIVMLLLRAVAGLERASRGLCQSAPCSPGSDYVCNPASLDYVTPGAGRRSARTLVVGPGWATLLARHGGAQDA